jgi:hypothetical protein
MNEETIIIRLYWQDLSENMQQKLLKLFGDNCNWDCIPIAVVQIDNDISHRDIVIDSFLGDEGLENKE